MIVGACNRLKYANAHADEHKGSSTCFLKAAAVDKIAIAPFCSRFIGVCVSYKNVSSCCLRSRPLHRTKCVNHN